MDNNYTIIQLIMVEIFQLMCNHYNITFGPGYRVYFGLQQRTWVILLCGGDKNRQDKDIQSAKNYWNDYKRRFAK